jgi:outer membrane protein TolC
MRWIRIDHMTRFYQLVFGFGLISIATAVAAAQQSQFQGSVPTGAVSATPLSLGLREAIDRGLRFNLGILVSESASEVARARRMQALSELLPQVTGEAKESVQQINLRTEGLTFNIPGLSFPAVVGPFHFNDVRAYGSVPVFDYSARKNYSSAQQSHLAAQFSYQGTRDTVVQAVANAYLQVIADASRAQALRAQVETDQALYQRASDQKSAGTAAGIDVLRAEVQLKQQQQQLLAQDNQLAKDKLALGRVIGLPLGQEFNIADLEPYSPLATITLTEALSIARDQRPDYQSARAQVQAAELAVASARGERYPTLAVGGDYGDAGLTPSDSHGTFTFTVSLKFNIFDGGRISADVLQARATLKQRQEELADLGGQIDYQVRTALLDIQSAADQVTVARTNLDLANQTLEQARDRFTAGVSDNIEVVQAQGTVATANDNLIGALYAHNLAKVALAGALGGAERSIQKFIEVK